jgi:hypothetical protein
MAGKKKSKLVIPKKIAGYKVPKALRKSDAVVRLAQDPMVRDICAAALAAAAAAMLNNKNVRDGAGKALSDGGSRTTQLVSGIGQAVAAAILGAIQRLSPESEPRAEPASETPGVAKNPPKGGNATAGNGPH